VCQAGLATALAAVVACAGPGAEAAEPEIGRIVIVPRLAGRRIRTDAPVPAEVTLETADPKVQRNLRARLVNASITLDDMELDAYTGVRGVAIDLDPANPIGTPGDQGATLVHPAALRRDGSRLRGAVDMEQFMRLVDPEDTRLGVTRSAQDLPAFHSPVRFAWDRVPGATSYRVDFIVRGGPARPAPAPIDTTITAMAVELPPSGPDESYVMALEALRGEKRIGTLRIDGPDMRASPYRFRVVPDEAPADAPQPPARSVVSDAFGGSARIELVPTLGGERWEPPPRTWARIGLYSEATIKILDVRVTNGAAGLSGLTGGTYSPNLIIVAGDEGPAPHSECRAYYGDQPAALRLSDGSTTRYEVPLRCAMRLRRPALPENTPSQPAEASSVASPVTFEWSAVPRAVRYTYEVREGWSATTTFARGEGGGTTWTTDVAPSLLPSESYRIEVTAHGRNGELGRLDGPYLFRVSGGTPEPGTGHVTLVPTFDGVPVRMPGEQRTQVWLLRHGTNESRTNDARLVNGAIELRDLETGIYGASFALDEEYPSPGLRPGADILYAETAAPIGLLRNGETVRREVAMYAPIEIVTPQVVAIGSTRRYGTAPELPVLTSPVRIAWKPVRGAKRYRISLETPAADTREPEIRVSESVARSWRADLSPTPPDEYYFVIITAHGARAQVGQTLFRFGVAGHGARSRAR
jgi:hypothetical protein